MPDENQSSWILIRVTGVSGTNVTTQLQIIYANGTSDSPSSMTTDMNDGSSSGVNNYLFLVNPNLNVNDTIYPTGLAYPVDQIVSRTYQNAQRDTIHFAIGTPEESVDAYSDRQTGVLVQLTDTYYDNSGYAELTLINSNVWTIQGASSTTSPSPATSTTPSSTGSTAPTPTAPEIPPTFAIPIIMTVILAGVAAYKLKHKNK